MTREQAVRWCTVAAVLSVAGVAAYVSYWHAVEVVIVRGEAGILGHLYPVVIDGVIVAASMVLLDAAQHHDDPPVWAWVTLVAGIAVTLCANVMYGARYGLGGALWAAWPAVAFVGVYEMLMLLVRASARRTAQVGHVPLPSAIANTAELAAAESLRATLAAGNPWSVNALATRFGLKRPDAARVHAAVLAEANGQAPEPEPDTTP